MKLKKIYKTLKGLFLMSNNYNTLIQSKLTSNYRFDNIYIFIYNKDTYI